MWLVSRKKLLTFCKYYRNLRNFLKVLANKIINLDLKEDKNMREIFLTKVLLEGGITEPGSSLTQIWKDIRTWFG